MDSTSRTYRGFQRSIAWLIVIMLTFWVTQQFLPASEKTLPVVGPVQGGLINEPKSESKQPPALIQTIAGLPESASSILPTMADAPQILGSSNPEDIRPDDQGALIITFGLLSSYKYELPDPVVASILPQKDAHPAEQIPDYIKNLDGKRVTIEGFMVPIDFDGDKVKTFILTYSQMLCCFGMMPWINEWIYVETAEGLSTQIAMDRPVTVTGVLSVGEEIEDGYVVSLYRLKAEGLVVSDTSANPLTTKNY